MDDLASRDYSEIAKESRLKCLELIWRAQTSHIGSVFSVADIMAVLFEQVDLDKDKVILSAGWKAAMLYYHLWRKGRITQEQLDSYCQQVSCYECRGIGKRINKHKRQMKGGPLEEWTTEITCHVCDGSGRISSKFIGLAEPINPDIPFAGGSMGMGLAAGVGLAWSKKQRGEEGTVYVIESDGGMQVGITWEAIMFAAHHQLDNLVLIIDNNGFQAMGKTKDILQTDMEFSRPGLHRILEAFGWSGEWFDGHNYDEIEYNLKYRFQFQETPWFMIANTVKGKGVSFMENNNLYHYKQLSEEEYCRALEELVGLTKGSMVSPNKWENPHWVGKKHG